MDQNINMESEGGYGFLGQETWNLTQHITLENLKMDSHMIWLLCSLLSSTCWVVYITFYNSRIIGLLLTKLVNKWLINGAYFKIGSLNINPLAGKIMFRDVVYICFDYSVRVQDGYIIFRWWRSYVPKDVSEDLSHSDTRLSITLNGFEHHVYNRSALYNQLEATFGLTPSILLPMENLSAEELTRMQEHAMNMENNRQNLTSLNERNRERSEAMTATTWRDLIPVIKIDICSGRFVCGNRLTPTTLSISVEEAHCVYSTKPAVCQLDHFMHFVKAKVENAKVLFAPSPKYTGLVDEPPRYMGEGFVVMMANTMELYFYMDEPGVVPEVPVHLVLANGDIVEPAPPMWGIDIKCGKATDFSYGPWADRQRDHLFKFFFPPDWQEMVVTQPPKPGELRQYQSFDLSLCTLNEATIDILFSKEKETNAMHITVGPGSYFEMTIPWVTQSDGFTTKVSGQLLHVEATTSLQYRSLAECETLEYKIRVHYPRKWNNNQEWTISLTGCKATAYIVYKHKIFFHDLIEDWASKSRPDILSFIPYTCKLSVLLKEFEILTLSNEYNWIDCSSTNQENHHLAVCGDLFDLSLCLPFDNFLPTTVTLKFWIHGEGLDLSLYLPEISTTRPVLLALDENAKLLTRSGKIKNRLDLYSKKWRRICQRSMGWVDCWAVPIGALSIQYIYHPIPPLGPDPQADITTPEKEEILLSPMRIPKIRKSPALNWTKTDYQKFDPLILTPDRVNVDLEIGSSVLLAYGAVLRNFIHLKENIFGVDQNFTDMEQSNLKTKVSGMTNINTNPKEQLPAKDFLTTKSISSLSINEENQKTFDPRLYRPLEVIVSLTIHDIQAHLMKNCGENDVACPIILVERLGFEMKKRYTETKLQVLVSPSYLVTTDNFIRPSRDKHLKQGHLLLSAVQVRGHAMFSNENCKLDDDTLEYAWLLEIQLGKISGKLTLPQLCNIVVGLETFAFLTVDPENCLKSPKTMQTCHHGVFTHQCQHSKEENKYRCPSSEDIKYKMTRISIDAIDLYLVESGTALHTWISPIRLSTCNLHGQRVKSGISGLFPTVLIRLFVLNTGVGQTSVNTANTNTTGSNRSSKPYFRTERREEVNNSRHRKNSGYSKKDLKEREEPKKRGTTDNNDDIYNTLNRERNQRENDMLAENWLEVGYTSFGPILIEGASALPIPDHKLHIVQHNFLRVHDVKTKRLWFLWGGEISRCGCIGGCAFFGTNRNGLKFFKPTSQDISDNYNIARYRILNKSKEYGFGESILHEGQLVFHTPPYSLHPVSLQETFDPPEKNLPELRSSPSQLQDILADLPTGPIKKSSEQIGSPTTLERRSKRYSYSSKIHSIEVPYARLLDSPSRKSMRIENIDYVGPSPISINRRGSDSKSNKDLKISTRQTSVSDSRLTGEEYINDEIEVPDEMSHSAPQSHPLEFDIIRISTSQVSSGENINREVQRTTSLTSENPSEMFFSAEEDVSNNMSQGYSSKTKSQNFHDKKRFSSDLSIGCHNEIGSVLSTHRSELEIYNSEIKVSPKRPQSTTELGDSKRSSTDTPSLSSTSFISAMSSQEDMTLINLHMQVNRPIVDSPLLMASYLSHLAQAKCSNWNSCSFPTGADAFSIPLFQECDNGGLVYIGNKMIPNFELCSNRREIKLIPRLDSNVSSLSGGSYMGVPRSHPWDPNVLLKEDDGEKSTVIDDGEFLSLQSESASCTSVVIRIKGRANVFLTPLVLEGLQRMSESLIPTMSAMHILTVVNFIHSFCIQKVKKDNVLKRDQSLSYWSQVHSNSKRSTTERNLQGPGDSVLSDVYEESIYTKTQGLIVLPKISVALLQSSIVEEVISISALDNIQDLSCVSLLSFYIEGVSTKFHFGKTTRASMHNVYIQQSIRSGNNSKKGGIMKGTRALLAHLSSQTRPDNIQGEPILIETSEKQLEELVITLDIGKAHVQLRRLRNEGCSFQDSQTVITAIPEHKSQVMFECMKSPDQAVSDSVGFIMCECGLEGVAIKIVKRSHFEKSENSKDDVNMQSTENNVGNLNFNDMCSTTNSVVDGGNQKAESGWRLISKKPPTPKTPKEKFTHALELIVSEKENSGRDVKTKFMQKGLSSPEPEEPSQSKKKKTEKQINNKAKDSDKTSSCVIELKSVWLNFAAPPCAPITRKIDFTRLDWNLLSTASPAITAWMNPSNRLAIKVVALLRSVHSRHTAVAACLMADALDSEKIQRNPKSKKTRYPANFTLLSKTLQEDPSCQICTIMQKLVLEESVEKIESIFKRGDIPHLNILRQGVIVLSRQWKNSLYNPILFEHQYKNRLIRPLNVAFNFPQTDEECDDCDFDNDPEISQYGTVADAVEESEDTLLLGQSGCSNEDSFKFGTAPFAEPTHNIQYGPIDSLQGFRKNSKNINKLSASSHITSARSSIQMLPIISGLVEKQTPEIEYGTLQEGSLSSTNSVDKCWSTAPQNHKEDLYFWMAKHQENNHKKEYGMHCNKNRMPKQFNNINAKGALSQDSIKLLDAHLIFEPILTCLGVMPQQLVNNLSNSEISSFENFGTNLSLVGTFDSLRVDIVVSEAGEKKFKQNINKKNTNGKPPVTFSTDAPSFLCERVGIELEVLKITDRVVDNFKQHIIYISRGQMKKHTSTVVNFSLNIRFISQQVNMPLLRLLHQITNMYQNVKDAQTELSDQPDLNKKSSNVKDESSLASETNDIGQFGSISDRFTYNDSLDERYDKFNDEFPLGHSINRGKVSGFGPIIQLTPSPNSKNRPQSFAQKLRSTGKSVKGKLGYTNLNESNVSPLKESPTSILEQNIFKLSLESKSSINGCGVSLNEDYNATAKKTLYSVNSHPILVAETPNCWKTIHHLLQLYGTMPETKTVVQRSSLSTDANDPVKQNIKKTSAKSDIKDDEDVAPSATPIPQAEDKDYIIPERTRLIIFGVAKIHKTRLLATLSGLKLEAEITTLHSSVTWRKKARPVSLECSLTGQVGRTMIVLLEGVAPSQQTVVKVTIGKSQTLYSSVTKRDKDKNSGLLSVGPVNIDIPQHPVALHGMMTRSSKQLSSTLQELRVGRSSARSSKPMDEPDSPFHSKDIKDKSHGHQKFAAPMKSRLGNRNGLLQPLVMQFNILLQSLSIHAALLPSLEAQYKMNHVSSTGVTGSQAKFVVDLPSHSLSFTTKIHSTEANLPSEACIALPEVHVGAEYIPENGKEDKQLDGVVLRQGGYLSASAEIGVFERCLTTDLLNHLVFVQKVFMKEINEVLQKVYGGEKPVPLWLEDSDGDHDSPLKRILFSLSISVKRIQLTATTPCSSAVRFETGTLDLHLSNRVKNIGEGSDRKLFGKAQIDLNLSLGQIIKNIIFDEAEPEFQQNAFFNTTIGLRNAFQEEILNDDKELILLTLKRPLIYIQPVAVDKAILVWLNYKNAYEYWAEKRANINYESQSCSHQVFERASFGQLGNLASANLSTLFLQLTVEDMGMCLPLNSIATSWGSRSYQDFEPRGAVVITLENTIISACNSGSLVSKGRFSGLCLRFADDFETTLDDWKPNMNDSSIMNLCVVSEGTYEVCSRTVAAKRSDNAKWLLNVKWQMEGVDIHLDVNIGKQLSSLGHTLTMLTGSEEEELNTMESPDSDEGDTLSKEIQNKKRELENLPSFVFDPSIDSKKRSIMMEKEMSEQLKIINDLRTLGASHNTIVHEERRLQELQALCYKYFRRDMIQKWKRPSIRRSMLKTTNRSQSFVASSFSKEMLEDHSLKKMDTILSKEEVCSLQNTPIAGPSRSASLKIYAPNPTRVTFSEAMRQTSLPNADSDIDFVENDLDWMPYDTSDNNFDDGSVELRKKMIFNNTQKQPEPNIDFELDIKVLVNSGKCVLHTKDISDERFLYGQSNKHHKRERSFGNEWGSSPTPSRRHRDKSKLRYYHTTVLVDITIFHIPGLDVKLHYESKTVLEDISPKLSVTEISAQMNRRLSNKRASLFAWMTLQSIPEETIISPHILEFLEQTLEPIPTKTENTTPISNPVNIDILQSNYVTYASFPVDVIVYFHMQPSTFRFSCLPVSRVECMLQLPSLDIVFSSKRSEDEEQNDVEKMPAGGLSVTGCLSDFNVYIFHPYGGKKSGIKEAQFSPLTDNERKDSLSINVEFVKFHLTRCRKLHIEQSKRSSNEQSRAIIRFSTIIDIGSASFKYDMRRLTEILAFPKAWYRRRIVRRLFLGDLSVEQKVGPIDAPDMHQPTFSEMPGCTPATLAKKDTICETSYRIMCADNLKLSLDNEVSNYDKLKGLRISTSIDSSTSPSEQNQITAWETLVLFAVNFTKLNVQMNMGNVMGNVVWLTKDFQSDGRLSIGSTGYKNMCIGVRLAGSSLDAKGGIVGGNFELNKIDTQFHIKEEAGVEPHHTIGLKLMALELRLDYMGTSVLMARISSLTAALKDEWKTVNDVNMSLSKNGAIIFIHGDLFWDQLQIIISKSTTADLLKMFFKLDEFFSQQFKSSRRVFSSLDPSLNDRTGNIKRKQKKFVITDETPNTECTSTDARHHRHWQKPLQQANGLIVPTLVAKLPKRGNILGGTIELHGHNISLACFHGINFKSKSWALFSLREPCINFTTEAQETEAENEINVIQTLTFGLGQNSEIPHNHSMAIVSRISRNVIFPPQFKTLNEWFYYAFANSDIDAVDRFPMLEKDREIATNSIERIRSSSSGSKLQEHNHNREVIFALPSLQLHFKTEHKQGFSTPDISKEKPIVICSFITEFDDHIFVTVDADAFFFLHDLITSYLKEKEKVIGAQTARTVSPNSSTNSTSVTQTNMPQGSSSTQKTSVAHNNFNKDSFKKRNDNDGSTTLNENGEKYNLNEDNGLDLDTFMKDWRHFECKTWHLEPTVRLLSWAGKSIEPYGIDYILNKLGFSHARTTIPKWLQRGFMDPLDKIQSILMLQLISVVKDNRNDMTYKH